MAETSRFIYEQLQFLRLDMDRLLQIKQDLCNLKSNVEDRIDLIEKALKEAQLPLLSVYANANAKRGRGVVEDDQLNLKSKSRRADALSIRTSRFEAPLGMETPLMTTTSNSGVPYAITDYLPHTLDQDVWELRQMILHFSQASEPLHMDKEKVEHAKAIVASGCELLHKVKLSTTFGGAKVTPVFLYEQLLVLIEKIDHFLHTEEPLHKMQLKFSVEDHFDLIEKVFKMQIGGVVDEAFTSGSFPVSNLDVDSLGMVLSQEIPLMEATLMCDIRKKISLFFDEACLASLAVDMKKVYHIKGIVEDVFDYYLQKGQLPANIGGAKVEPRFLLVSSGCAICLLDLKLLKEEPLSNADVVRPLPVIATLRLLEEQLPVSVGLFRLSSGAYMIGGHMFPPMTDRQMIRRMRCYKDNPSSGELYECLLKSHLPLKGSSRAMYRLTLKDGHLCHTKCNSMELQNPKFWPIIEEVDGKVHVFDSDPNVVVYPDSDAIFSHEVLECDGGSWIIIPTQGLSNYFISCHVVLGHKIYAISARECLLFDSRKRKWNTVDRKRENVWLGPFSVKCVWDILIFYKFAWIVGEIKLGGAEPDDRLYVILALRSELHSKSTVVYIVTSMGQVVCIQSLPHLFSMGPLEPGYVLSGTMTKADEGTVCVILNSFPSPIKGNPGDGAHLFIFTFTVKELCGAASKFMAKRPHSWEDLSMSGGSCFDFTSKRLEEYVRVDIKDTYIFRTNADFEEEDADMQSEFIGIRACFMDGNI